MFDTWGGVATGIPLKPPFGTFENSEGYIVEEGTIKGAIPYRDGAFSRAIFYDIEHIFPALKNNTKLLSMIYHTAQSCIAL